MHCICNATWLKDRNTDYCNFNKIFNIFPERRKKLLTNIKETSIMHFAPGRLAQLARASA